jgi:alcohol dehydrogenase
LPQKCATLFKYGHQRLTPERPFAGGLADWILLVEGTACLRVPDKVADMVAAPANCAMATVAAALRRGGRVADRTVLVLGAGQLGLTACALARSAGARHVLVSDPDPTRRGRAAAFGATRLVSAQPDELAAAVAESTEGRGADLVLELAGVAEAVQASLTSARIGGTVVLAGTVLPTAPVALDPEKVVRNMLTIRGLHNYAACDLDAAVAFLAGPGQTYPFASLVGPSFRLDETAQAFGHARDNPGSRVAVIP